MAKAFFLSGFSRTEHQIGLQVLKNIAIRSREASYVSGPDEIQSSNLY
jgi:hypothetical protein